MWGRCIGFGFAVPFAYFAAKKQIPKQFYPRLIGLFSLGGLQGLIGWWMVKSGLDQKTLGHCNPHATEEVGPVENS